MLVSQATTQGGLKTKRRREDVPRHATTQPYESESSERIVFYALAGNLVIFSAKYLAAQYSGSSAMLAEAVHSAVDAGNQALLLIGLRSAARSPSALHPYGWGKSVYLWSLVSALGTFWLGGGVSAYSSICELMRSSTSVMTTSGMECGLVLGISFAVDGFVLWKSWGQFLATKPQNRSALDHLRKTQDPTVLAVLMEDAAACTGVAIAATGIALSKATNIAAFDAASGLAVGILLASVGAALAMLNGKYLIGSAVDKSILDDIDTILRSRPAIDDVHSVQAVVVGPDAFSYKCEVDFDANVLAAMLAPRYEAQFATLLLNGGDSSDRKRLSRLLALYAEDVMTLLEAEVRQAELLIRQTHPAALFIEIEPDASAGFVLPDPQDDDFTILDPPTKDEWVHRFVDPLPPPDPSEDETDVASSKSDDVASSKSSSDPSSFVEDDDDSPLSLSRRRPQ